ncbi:far upstream element-binding protein 1-like, partial [Hordeum vulgare subsp. vulgare]|uniref:far upstream element-binding protein 1-like n=1 Tax=Hordeum vulgare subsp. vulgare TaxID=112509 RepID=UPI001D1A405E
KWKVGVIIGKGGETIKHIQLQSGAKIQVTRDMDVQSWSQTRLVDLSSTPDHISRAEQLISDVLAEAHAGLFGTIPNWKYNAPQPSVEQFQMQIANKVN